MPAGQLHSRCCPKGQPLLLLPPASGLMGGTALHELLSLDHRRPNSLLLYQATAYELCHAFVRAML